jgi:hypothetical protein
MMGGHLLARGGFCSKFGLCCCSTKHEKVARSMGLGSAPACVAEISG